MILSLRKKALVISLNRLNKLKYNLRMILSMRVSIILFMLYTLIIAVVVSLYNVPFESILYSLVLVCFIALLVLIYSFYRIKQKHNQLLECLSQSTLHTELLPHSKSMIEDDYQNIIVKLRNENQQIQNLSDHKYNDLHDISTLWAHQIKTPIAAMRLLLQSNEIDENEELKYELFEIEQYVQMLLGYFRLNAQTNDFVLKQIDCELLVRSVIRQYAKVFIRKKIQLELGDINITPISDEKWLGFVIEQILSNALKYTNEGKISIYTGNDVLVIQDTGIGIQEEDLPRVFEKGYTGYNGRSDKKSTGMGLYLCKIILQKMGHKISIESKINIGTTVRIDLKTIQVEIE